MFKFNKLLSCGLTLFCLCTTASTMEKDEKDQDITVACYLKYRLEEIGLKRLFGVAGNYTAPFLDTIIEDNEEKKKKGERDGIIEITGTSNEICAGYAADGYARIRGKDGIGAVATTYGVGSYSLLNAVAGSFAEQVPVVVINGAPTNKEFANQQFSGLLYYHMIPNQNSNIDVFRNVTVSSQRISNAIEAPLQIDTVLTACITYQKPVYLEVLEDVWRVKLKVPVTNGKIIPPITKEKFSYPIYSRNNIDEAVTKTFHLMKKHQGKEEVFPLFWAGIEIQRFGLENIFKDLLDAAEDFMKEKSGEKIKYATALLGKSLISENDKRFYGVGLPDCLTNPTPSSCIPILRKINCLIGLGTWTTSTDFGGQGAGLNHISDKNKVIVSQGGAFVGGAFLPNVPLQGFMEKFKEKLKEEQLKSESILDAKLWAEYPKLPPKPTFLLKKKEEENLNYDNFLEILNDSWIKSSSDTTVVVDASLALFASGKALHMNEPNSFVSQASWGSIGYAAPAAVGIKCAIDDYEKEKKRVVVIAGDGGFQETCQAVSSYAQLQQNTAIFVLANSIYGVVQLGGNPNPFRDIKNDESEKDVYKYNELGNWNYEKLADVFGKGIVGREISTVDGLEKTIEEIKEDKINSFIVHVKIDKHSIPSIFKNKLNYPGEDEHNHTNWPPKNF